jgi:cytochrome c551/c552
MRASLFALAGLLGCAPALGADVSELLVQKRCNACHEHSSALLGPPWVAVAARHQQNKDVMIEVLARKIVMGGGGTWGLVPMVPNEHVTMEEAREMARWILEQRTS